MSDSTPTVPRQQALRMKRFLIASVTYVLGLGILGLCSTIGLFPSSALVYVGAAFATVNVAFFAALHSGWNLRFADPSLTLAQVCAAAGTVALILMLGKNIHFVAVPFYSSLFVFAMLQLGRRELAWAEGFILASYTVAMGLRVALYAGQLDLRVEALHAALVVLTSVWYALAASYISTLRARLRSSVLTIEKLATRDALTDTWNRRHIDTLLAAELQRKRRFGGTVCIALVDLDHFKAVNDLHGHLVGDEVLAASARCMQARVRTIDQLGRFGGEEFLVLLPGTELHDAAVCIERMRGQVASLTWPRQPDMQVTISVGLVEAAAGESAAQLLARADEALYRAKAQGRDRVVLGLATGPGLSMPRAPGEHPAPGADMHRVPAADSIGAAR